MRNDSKLNERQKMFCKEYIIDLNATQASIRAGYSEKTARQMGSENLSKPYIQDEIASLIKEREERVKLTADKVLEDIERVRTLAEGSEQYSVSLKASELQGKHLAMFTDKQQINGQIELPKVEIVYTDE